MQRGRYGGGARVVPEPVKFPLPQFAVRVISPQSAGGPLRGGVLVELLYPEPGSCGCFVRCQPRLHGESSTARRVETSLREVPPGGVGMAAGPVCDLVQGQPWRAASDAQDTQASVPWQVCSAHGVEFAAARGSRGPACAGETATVPEMTPATAQRTRPPRVDAYEEMHSRLDNISNLANGHDGTEVPPGTVLRASKLLVNLDRSGLAAPEDIFATSDGAVMLCWHDEDVSIMVAANERAHISVSGVASNDDAAIDGVAVCGLLLGRPLHQRKARR